METVAGVSPNLHLAAWSYHTAGAQYLMIIWTTGSWGGGSEREAFAGNYARGHKLSQASKIRDSFQIRSGLIQA